MNTHNIDDDVVDYAQFHGDEILESAGRQPDEEGNWSQEDVDWLWQMCKEIVHRTLQS